MNSTRNNEKLPLQEFFFFVTFFFLFKIIYNREAYFINYNLQTNEKKNLPSTLPVPQVTVNEPLLPTPPS